MGEDSEKATRFSGPSATSSGVASALRACPRRLDGRGAGPRAGAPRSALPPLAAARHQGPMAHAVLRVEDLGRRVVASMTSLPPAGWPAQGTEQVLRRRQRGGDRPDAAALAPDRQPPLAGLFARGQRAAVLQQRARASARESQQHPLAAALVQRDRRGAIAVVGQRVDVGQEQREQVPARASSGSSPSGAGSGLVRPPRRTRARRGAKALRAHRPPRIDPLAARQVEPALALSCSAPAPPAATARTGTRPPARSRASRSGTPARGGA